MAAPAAKQCTGVAACAQSHDARQCESITPSYTYDRAAKAVTYRSDTSEGPTVGTATADPLEFLARVLVHIIDKGDVTTR